MCDVCIINIPPMQTHTIRQHHIAIDSTLYSNICLFILLSRNKRSLSLNVPYYAFRVGMYHINKVKVYLQPHERTQKGQRSSGVPWKLRKIFSRIKNKGSDWILDSYTEFYPNYRRL